MNPRNAVRLTSCVLAAALCTQLAGCWFVFIPVGAIVRALDGNAADAEKWRKQEAAAAAARPYEGPAVEAARGGAK